MNISAVHGLPDGTYHLSRVTGQVEDYAAKWAYGYIVGIKPLDRDPQFGELFGVWRNGDTTYVDLVEHISDRGTAEAVARARRELSLYDLRERKVILL